MQCMQNLTGIDCNNLYFLEPGQSEEPPPYTLCSNKNYYSFGDSCFRLDSVPKMSSDAQALCAADGGQLASITDAYYEAFVEYLLYTNGVTDAWLGMKSDDVSYNYECYTIHTRLVICIDLSSLPSIIRSIMVQIIIVLELANTLSQVYNKKETANKNFQVYHKKA